MQRRHWVIGCVLWAVARELYLQIESLEAQF